ncbi:MULTISPECIES: hypothetical protein [Fusobacterium]|uniref:hypothetical protein n=1 Tax=Fusobacterium TaxID=848 RepID=UPI0014775B6A|nr:MULTISPECIES: hypothetical protein [Fusobacterium]NME35787.1 hypothetical protein [Fusobacterium sp. FSA-380-WT-3A]
MKYKNIDINIRKLLHHPIKYSKWIKEEIIYEENKKYIEDMQNLNFDKFYPKDIKKLIVLIVPGNIKINGGVMSICAIAKISKEILEKEGYHVIIVTIPQDKIFYEYTEFDTEFKIFRFEQILKLEKIDEIMIHVPECYVEKFLETISEEQKAFLLKINNRQINILNQNIELMPGVEYTEKLKNIYGNVTMTTAHKQYCTEELMNKYKMSVHMLSADYLANYVYRDFEEKENIIIYSPDNVRFYKRKIINKLRKELKDFKIIEIRNMRYKDYLDLTSRAKFAITFGEGLDGYFLENIVCGGVAFAVYNEKFFSQKYEKIETLYSSYKEMEKNIILDIENYINDISRYRFISDKLKKVRDSDYSFEEYKENIKKFYLKEYTFRY